jgi:hypothetical protein
LKQITLKPVPGHPDIYASNLGELWSRRSGGWRILKPHQGGGRIWDSRGGYLRVTVRYRDRGNKPSSLYIHRAVCEAFHGPAPEPGYQYVVDHKDFNWKNNKPDNLRWMHKDENQARKKPPDSETLTEQDLEVIFGD